MLFAARIVDGLSGGNISTARAYVADVTEPKDRARAYGLIGAAFGLGFIFGPALSGVLAQISYTAPIWAAAAVTLVATVMAWFWLPETVHRAHAGAGNPFRYLPALLRRPRLRRMLAIDFVYWFAFATFQTTFALFAARRFGFDAAADRLLLRRVRHPRRGHPGRLHPADRRAGSATNRRSRWAWCLRDRPGGGGVGADGHRCSRWRWCRWRSASASATRRWPAWSAAPARGDEQGRVQGAASAVESLGRTVGPVWGNASLQQFGESTPYLSAAVLLLVTMAITAGLQIVDADALECRNSVIPDSEFRIQCARTMPSRLRSPFRV